MLIARVRFPVFVVSRLRFHFSLLCLLLLHPNIVTEGATRSVGKTKQYNTIRTAVLASIPFDTVLVYPGVYEEHSIVIDKPLTIRGLNSPTIDAKETPAEIFVIVANRVRIEGCVLTNVGMSYLHEYAAIKIRSSRSIAITHNRITNCFFGIYLENATNVAISDNHITGTAMNEASAGNGIHLWKSKAITISRNEVIGHRDGIYLEFVDSSSIESNAARNNLRYGLHFMFSNNDRYIANEFRNNGTGVAVMFSRNIVMTRNTFADNWGQATYGLLLKEISDGEISGNTFHHNTTGILAEGANRLSIRRNRYSENGTAMDIKGNCMDNLIAGNTFLSNTFEVVTNTRHNRNRYRENYWSQYNGYDLNRDGFGDTPYRPVNVMAKITDQVPSATILMHSLLADLLTLVERMFPTLIPEQLIDERPRMKPYIDDHYSTRQ